MNEHVRTEHHMLRLLVNFDLVTIKNKISDILYFEYFRNLTFFETTRFKTTK